MFHNFTAVVLNLLVGYRTLWEYDGFFGSGSSHQKHTHKYKTAPEMSGSTWTLVWKPALKDAK